MYRLIFVLVCICLFMSSCERNTSPQESVPAPEISPQSGTYLSSQMITLGCALSDAFIHYTLDGTDPTSESPVYSVPLEITQSTVVKAMARKKGWKDSQTATAEFTLMASPVYLSPESGTYDSPLSVTIYSASSDITIHYTLDGSEPSETSPVYAEPILLNGNTFVKATGFKTGWIHGETASGNYEFEAVSPEISLQSGLYYSDQNVSFTTSLPGAQIRYTTDGSDPVETSALYDAPISVNHSLILKARTYKPNWNPGQIAQADYQLKVSVPFFSPLPGNFGQEQEVAITCLTPESVIRYTTDSSEPDENSTQYSSPVNIKCNSVLQAKAFRTGWTASNTTTGNYNLLVATPSALPSSGTYLGPQTVTLSCTTPYSQIRYTMDGSVPTEASTLYSEPFLVSTSRTLTARAFRPNWLTSFSNIAYYTIIPIQTVATPVFDPEGGTYGTAQVISISCSTQDAVIRYTTDNTEPNSASMIFTSPITIYQTTTFKAKGFKPGWNQSPTATSAYNINIYHEPLIGVEGGIFTMGCTNGTGDPDETPLHSVSLSDFLMSNHEVTQQEYEEVMGSNPSEFDYGPTYPVDNVSFYDAVAFCNKRSARELYMPCYEYVNYGFDVDDWPVGWNTSTHNNIICHFEYDGYRLPTEAEWEYAAKGGNLSHNYLYSGGNNLSLVGWFNDNSGLMTHPVCQKAFNELGLYDMSGNLWEICWDWYGPYEASTTPVFDPHGPDNGTGKVFRGGMWQAPAEYARSSNRSWAPPPNIAASYGFRVVRSVISN